LYAACGQPASHDNRNSQHALRAHGVKGCGEVGTIGSPAAVANAVVDALAHLGVNHVDMPASANRLWRIVQRASLLRAAE
jgi:aerobic carbon-monoxide dehydrogenase large subunit